MRGYGIGFDYCSKPLIPDCSMVKTLFSFGVNRSSFVHIGNKKKYILNLGIRQTHGLDATKFEAGAQYSINFWEIFQEIFKPKMWKKTGLLGYVYNCPIYYNTFGTICNNIIFFDSFGVENIANEIWKIKGNKNIITNI